MVQGHDIPGSRLRQREAANSGCDDIPMCDVVLVHAL